MRKKKTAPAPIRIDVFDMRVDADFVSLYVRAGGRRGVAEYTQAEFGALPFDFKIPPERVLWVD
jgi:hypothetical protein